MSLIPVFVINRKSAAGRLNSMDCQLRALGISYERFPAVEGTELTAEFIERFAPTKTWVGKGRPSAGEVGCFLSHVRLLELIRDRGHERACILEDDIELAPDFASFLRSDLEWPSGVDVLKLEIAAPKPRLNVMLLGNFGQRELVFIPEGGEPGSAAYIVTAPGIKKLLSDFQTMIDVYDWQAFKYWRHGGGTYHLLPLPAVQTRTSEISRPRGQKMRQPRVKKFLSRRARNSRSIMNSLRKVAYQITTFGVWRTVLHLYQPVRRSPY